MRRHPHITSYNRSGATFYKVSFQLLNQNIRKSGFASFQEAEEFYISVRLQIRAGTYVKQSLANAERLNLDALYERYKKTSGSTRAHRTQVSGQKSWSRHISPILGQKRPQQITSRMVSYFVDGLRFNSMADNSIGTVLAELFNVLRFCLDFDLISEMPRRPRLNKKPEKKQIFSPLEIQSVIENLNHPMYAVMAFVQYQLALRFSELLALQKQDFDLNNRRVRIHHSLLRYKDGPFEERLAPTKNRTDVWLPLSEPLLRVMTQYLDGKSLTGSLWKDDYRGSGYVSNGYYNAQLKKAAKAAGIQRKISSHCLRASMLSWLVNHSGLNVNAAAFFGRHDTAVMLARYTQKDAGPVFKVFGVKQGCDRGQSYSPLTLELSYEP